MSKPQPVRVQYRDEFPATPSLTIDGRDVTNVVSAGMTITHRTGQHPLIRIEIAEPAIRFEDFAEVEVGPDTLALLRAAGWVKAEEAPLPDLLTALAAAGIEGDDARTAVESFAKRLREIPADELHRLFGPDAVRVAAIISTGGVTTA